jgi:hypothetical protein
MSASSFQTGTIKLIINGRVGRLSPALSRGNTSVNVMAILVDAWQRQ